MDLFFFYNILWVSNYNAFDVPCAVNNPCINPIPISIEPENRLDILGGLTRYWQPFKHSSFVFQLSPREVCMKEVTKGECDVLVSNIQLSHSRSNEPSFALPYLWDILTFVMLTEVKSVFPHIAWQV